MVDGELGVGVDVLRDGVHRVHADVAWRAVLGKALAAHVLGPLEAELAHVLLAAVARAQAHRATRSDGGRTVAAAAAACRWHADGRVHGAEEEAEVGRAVDLDQGPELVRLHRCLLLRVVVELVGHRRRVVRHLATHGHRDRLTFASSDSAASWQWTRHAGVVVAGLLFLWRRVAVDVRC